MLLGFILVLGDWPILILVSQVVSDVRPEG